MIELLITVQNSYSYISKSFNGLARPLQNYLVTQLSYQKKQQFGSIPVYLLMTNPVKLNTLSEQQGYDLYYMFPTGLIYKLLRLLQENKIPFRISDLRIKLPVTIPISEFYRYLKKVDSRMEERDYQVETLEKAIKIPRGIINHATSAGKTITISGLIYCLNVKTLVLCKGTDHVNQISEDIRKYTGRTVSIITGGSFNLNGDVVISNVQALDAIKKRDESRYKNILAQFKYVVSDECHRISSDTNKSIVYHCVNAYYRHGFSGTIHREDGAEMEIIAAIGPIISKVDYTFLTENKYIVPARCLFIDPMCRPLTQEEDVWPICLHAGITENDKRNLWLKTIASVYTKRDSQVLIISPFRVEHGKKLQQLIPTSVYLYGGSDKYHRKEVLKRFALQEFKVLIASNIFDEVINLPNLSCVILAGGGKAHNSVYQRIGRGVRKADNKTSVDIIIPWDSHSSVLLKHVKRVYSLISKIDVWKDKILFVGKYRKSYE